MRNIRFLAGVATGVLGLVVVLQNSAPAQLRFLGWSVEGPMYLLLLFVLCTGLVAGYLVGRAATRRKRKRAETEE